MDKIKFSCSLNSIRLAKDGEYKIEFLAPMSEMASAISMVSFVDQVFSFAMVSEGEVVKASPVSLHRVAVDREGETKVVLSIPHTAVDNMSLMFLGNCQQKPIVIQCKPFRKEGSGSEKEAGEDN